MIFHPEWQPNNVEVNDWEKPIYRIFAFERFIELLENSKNALVNPSKWDDAFENVFLRCELLSESGTLISMKNLEKHWYGQCWTTCRESDAMWRIYSPVKNGVRVQTTIERLFASLYNTSDQFRSSKYFIGPVRYFRRQEIENQLESMSFEDIALGGQACQFARTLLIKRREFRHEKEVRILLNDTPPFIGNNGIALFSLDPNQVFSEVTLDPRMPDDDFGSAKEKLTKTGCILPINQSDLYKIDRKPIQLKSSTRL